MINYREILSLQSLGLNNVGVGSSQPNFVGSNGPIIVGTPEPFFENANNPVFVIN